MWPKTQHHLWPSESVKRPAIANGTNWVSRIISAVYYRGAYVRLIDQKYCIKDSAQRGKTKLIYYFRHHYGARINKNLINQ
jgi:hypothetical protein